MAFHNLEYFSMFECVSQYNRNICGLRTLNADIVIGCLLNHYRTNNKNRNKNSNVFWFKWHILENKTNVSGIWKMSLYESKFYMYFYQMMCNYILTYWRTMVESERERKTIVQSDLDCYVIMFSHKHFNKHLPHLTIGSRAYSC